MVNQGQLVPAASGGRAWCELPRVHCCPCTLLPQITTPTDVSHAQAVGAVLGSAAADAHAVVARCGERASSVQRACSLRCVRMARARARAQVSVKDCLQPRATGRANPRHVGTARCIRDGGRQERASQAVSAQ